MPEYTMYISCAPNPDESVREAAVDKLGGTILLDDPVTPTYRTTITAPTRDAAAAWVSATLLAAGMQITGIDFVPAVTADPGATKAAPQPKSRTIPIVVAAVAAVAVGATLLGFYAAKQESSDAPATAFVSPMVTTTATTTSEAPAPEVITPEVTSTTAASPSIYAGMPCDSPGTQSPDGKFSCSGENLIWVDVNAAPSIYVGMPCDSPGTQSPDGKFSCSGENGVWMEANAAPLPTIGSDSIGQPCTSPGAKARLERSDGVLTCTSTGDGTYIWVAGPY